jgi:DNA-binding NtrC family response regulator
MLTAIDLQRIDVAVLNLSKPFDDDFETLAELQDKAPQAEVIFVAQFDDELMRAWMEVIRRGAYEFLPKPLNREELKYHLVHATEKHHPIKSRKFLPTTSTHNASAAGA